VDRIAIPRFSLSSKSGFAIVPSPVEGKHICHTGSAPTENSHWLDGIAQLVRGGLIQRAGEETAKALFPKLYRSENEL